VSIHSDLCKPHLILQDPTLSGLLISACAAGAPLWAEHVRQFGGESPLPNLMEVKG
jgi:hypothetical protein